MKTKTLLKAIFPIQIFFIFGVLNAQVITPTYIGVSDGVASPVVNAVIQDSYGLLWIATGNGLQKYDGYQFQTFRHDGKDSTSLQHNLCWGLLEDSKKNIWVGTSTGVSRFDRKTGGFKNYDFIIPQGSDLLRVFSIMEDSHNVIWAGTQGRGLMRYDEKRDKWIEPKFRTEKDNNSRIYNGTSFNPVEDAQGRLWVGLQQAGLFFRQSVGTEFQNAKSNYDLPIDFSVRENSITSLFVDSQNRLWITTRSGVYWLNPETGTFKTIISYPFDNFNVWGNWNCVREDKEGTIWVANNYHGILRLEKGNNTVEEIRIDKIGKLNNTDWELTLTTFSIDKSGIFWFGTRGKGIMKYDPVQKPFTTYTSRPGESGAIAGNSIFGLYASERNPSKIYVGLRGAGLDVFDENTRQFTHIPIQYKADMFGGSVRSILETDEGTLLVGTWGDGLLELDDNYSEINRLTYDSLGENLTEGKVRILKKDKKGQIWIGSTNGLTRWDRKANTFKNFKSLTTRRYNHTLLDSVYHKLSMPDTISILRVGDDAALSRPFEVKKPTDYLIATMGEGDRGVLFDYGWLANEKGDTIWSAVDFSKTFWAGGAVKNRQRIDVISLNPGHYTLHYNSDDSHCYGAYNQAPPDNDEWWGVAIAPMSGSSIKNSLKDVASQSVGSKYLSDANINAIVLTDSIAWIGTSGGLNRMDVNTFEVTVFRHDPADDNSLSDDGILDICFDDDGFLWIGTNNGLNKFDPKSGTFTVYTRESGLATNAISTVVNGANGEMWIATIGGLSRMVSNPSLGKVTFINYFKSDGLSSDNFIPPLGLRSKGGTYYFGSEYGLNTFRSVSGSQIPPDIILSSLTISGRSVADMGKNAPVDLPLVSLDNLNLSHDENDLGFEFTALQYADPSKNQYAHKLEGFDKDWSYDNRNFASYTNLEPGDYTFKIRASNAYGVWNEDGKNIRIHIASPWWRTWWAYAVYVLLMLAGIFMVDRILRKRIADREREKNRERELAQAKEIEKAYHKLEEAHDNLKSAQDRLVQQEKLASLGQLTAGIAHEIKNPLNFVNNFSDLSVELVDELGEEFEKGDFTGDKEEIKSHIADIRANLQKINQHGTRADGIVKSMLQHSRGGTGNMEPTDLNALVTEFVNLAFHGMRAAKNPINVILNFDLDENMGEVKVIADDFSRLVLNLTNNAFDAMREKAKTDPDYTPKLSVKTERVGTEIHLAISDNGPGIPAEIKDKILQPFFTTKKGTDGTGLGLSITNDIVKAHGGELTINTVETEGTTFLISLRNN